MDLALDGYRLTRMLRSSGTSQVWEALRLADRRMVIAKVFTIEDHARPLDPGARASNRARVAHEFEMIRRLAVPGVVQALALEHSGDQLILLLEAHRGIDLGELIRRAPLPLDRFLDLALQVTRILADVHEQRVLHRDIKPNNILIDPDTGEVVLADFGISELLACERSRIHDREVIEGTLPYMAPEQTGRTAREVDFRSDLYSLGVTFYEALTGQRPFAGDSPLELIHAHLARRPTPPQRLRPDLPRALDEVVMKLLEKAPERRYQSARGLAADLAALRDAMRVGKVGELVLGSADVPLFLQLPHQLYGRTRERTALLTGFRRALDKRPEFVVMIGDAGVGKTSLVHELREPLLASQGVMLRGAFAAESDQPLAGLRMALASLGDQLLTLTPEALERWRGLLRARLGDLAAVLVELVPSLRLVLGEATSDGGRTALEIRNQVLLACVRLLTCVARPDHPLVLVLDDVQWADAASFEVLAALVGETDASLLVVLLGRPDAIAPGSALSGLLAKLDAQGRLVEPLELAPLDRDALTTMVADMLSRPREAVTELAEIVARKTGSNPYFAAQLLLHLADRQLLRRESEGWTWDIAALEAAKLPDDVLDMMMGKLAALAGEQRRLLQVASVIGERFDVGLLTRASELADASERLPALIDLGLIAPLERGFAFGHEAIRAAAYASLDATERARLHLVIGRELADSLAETGSSHVGGEASEQRVFEVVEHLDRGHRLDELDARPVALDELALRELASLNLRAGQRALTSGAPSSAAVYLDVARRMLGWLGPFPGHGEPDRALHVETELASAQAELLLGHADEADSRLATLLERPLGVEELGRVADARVWVLTVSGRHRLGLEVALAALGRLGIAVPSWPSKRHMLFALLRLVRLARRRSLEHMRSRPPVGDPSVRAGLDILLRITTTTYMVSPEAFITMIVLHAELLLRHGSHRSSALVVAQLGMLAAVVFDRQRSALEIGQLARELAESSVESTPLRVQQACTFMRMWSEPYVVLLPELAELFERSLEQGQRDLAETLWVMRSMLAFYGGQHLRLVEAQAETHTQFPESWNRHGAVVVIEAARRLIEGPAPLPGQHDPLGRFDDPAGLEQLGHGAHIRATTAMLLAVFGRWTEVHHALEGFCAPVERAMGRIWFVPTMRLLAGIADAVVARSRRGRERRLLIASLRQSIRRFAGWNAHGANHHFHEAMLRGEQAALADDLAGAIAELERARTLAAELRNPLFEALASERLAAILLERDRARLALGALVDARDRYQHWGAFAKVAQLEQRWPELGRRPAIRATDRAGASTTTGGLSLITTTTGSSSSSTTSNAIDSATLLKASQTLSEDIRLDDVVVRVLDIALENAGAQRGVVLLGDHDQLGIAAESTADGARQRTLERPIPLREAADSLAATVVRFVERTRESVVLDDAVGDPRFASDPYLRANEAMSILCLPFIKRGRLVGLLYLENRLSAGSFSPERLELLRVLTAQTASALENARLYDELHTSESRWRSLVEQLPDFVMLVDRAGAIEYVNLGQRSRTTPLATLEPAALALGPAGDEIKTMLGRVFTQGSREHAEVAATLPTGEHRWFALRIAPILDDASVPKALVVATDITERKQADQQREQLEGQLRQQQRLESIGTLASGVAHEINNPIQGIMNYAELIAGSEGASEEVREFAGEIEVETQRVTTIVRNLLAFSRQELEEASEPIAIDQLIEGTLSLIRTVLRRDQITLEIMIPRGLPKLDCRRQQIQQVIMNLVTNARDALNARWPSYHEDKQIVIRAAAIEHEGLSWIRLSVEDRGGGVPVEVVPRIFDPFFTTKGRDQGTGLGLAVSHGIIRDHGGRFVLDNHPNEGACFSIELPVVAARRKAG